MASIQANYKLALYEKRLGVYVRLKECAFALTSSGTIEKETRQKLYQTLDDATFIFADEVVGYIKSLSDKADDLMRAEYRTNRLEKKNQRSGLTEEEEGQWTASLELEHEIEDWFIANLRWERLQEQFTPSLKLPADIK